MDAQAGVLGIIDTMERDLKGVWAPSGPLERFKAIPSQLWKIYGQADPQLTALHSRLEGTLALVGGALGEVGTLNEGDIKRARALQPTFAPIPDTAEVIVEKIQGLRDLLREVASRTGTRPEAMKGGGKPSGGRARQRSTRPPPAPPAPTARCTAPRRPLARIRRRTRCWRACVQKLNVEHPRRRRAARRTRRPSCAAWARATRPARSGSPGSSRRGSRPPRTPGSRP